MSSEPFSAKLYCCPMYFPCVFTFLIPFVYMCPRPLYKQELYNSDLSEGLVQNFVPGAKVPSNLGNIKHFKFTLFDLRNTINM